jgi:hypothetical protein
LGRTEDVSGITGNIENMSDKGKTATIEELRSEVGFGCPVCRSPFLTWHHFDPPSHIEEHWRPEGIIAMCPLCHGEADEKTGRAGNYSPDELRAMKKADYSSRDVKGSFISWQKENLLVRVGGCYTDTSAPVICVNGIPQITLSKNGAGLLSLSFQLRNQQNETLVEMQDNWFLACPKNIHDMTVTPKTHDVTIWLDEEDVGLQLSFERITMDKLERVLEQDRKRSEKKTSGLMQSFTEHLPPDIQKMISDPQSMRLKMPRLDGLPPEIREAQLSGDPTGYIVKEWARKNCMMDDGLIPFLNFEQMAIYFHGERITIKDGVADFLDYCSAINNGTGAINLPCRCAVCSPQSTV